MESRAGKYGVMGQKKQWNSLEINTKFYKKPSKKSTEHTQNGKSNFIKKLCNECHEVWMRALLVSSMVIKINVISNSASGNTDEAKEEDHTVMFRCWRNLRVEFSMLILGVMF